MAIESEVISDEDKRLHWEVVIACLVKFYKWEEAAAKKRVVQLQTDLAKDLDYPDLIYHDEPISTAARLSGNLNYDEHVDEYLKLRLEIFGI